MQTFNEKFNEVTNDKYKCLKLRNAKFVIDESLLIITFAYPEKEEKSILSARDDILSGAKRAFDGDVPNIEIKFVKSHFDRDFFLRDITEYLKQFPMLATVLDERSISTEINGNDVKIIFRIDAALVDYCNKKSAGKKIEAHIKSSYCENIDVMFLNVSGQEDESIEEFEKEMEEEKSRFSLESIGTGRTIRPQNVEAFIGNVIYDAASYIEDAFRECENITLCGSISGFRELSKKDNPERKFYKFNLRDFTKEISCLYFPTKKTEEQIKLLKDGKEIVAKGKINEDKMRPGSFTFFLREISLCTLPTDFKINRLRREVDDVYHVVFPQPYRLVKQTNLFDVAEPPPEFMLGKTFCVFDLETTGFALENDRIIEIGAVRIVDGVITDTFNTYVDPKLPIPEKIIKLTGIKDSDVMGQPTIDEVMPDFYKYSHGCVLVGQNVQFDYGFISVNGARQNIYFDNDMMDTMTMARQYVPTLKKYKLSYLTDYFHIENISAHRGIYDALATAEVFINLIKLMQNA